MIFYRDYLGGDSLMRKTTHSKHVFTISTNKTLSYQPITFTPKYREGVLYPHNDAMMIVANINEFTVKRVLVDRGSSYNMLTWEATTGL